MDRKGVMFVHATYNEKKGDPATQCEIKGIAHVKNETEGALHVLGTWRKNHVEATGKAVRNGCEIEFNTQATSFKGLWYKVEYSRLA